MSAQMTYSLIFATIILLFATVMSKIRSGDKQERTPKQP